MKRVLSSTRNALHLFEFGVEAHIHKTIKSPPTHSAQQLTQFRQLLTNVPERASLATVFNVQHGLSPQTSVQFSLIKFQVKQFPIARWSSWWNFRVGNKFFMFAVWNRNAISLVHEPDAPHSHLFPFPHESPLCLLYFSVNFFNLSHHSLQPIRIQRKNGKTFPKNIIRLLNFTSKIFTWSLSCVLMFEKWTAIELDDARTRAMLWLHPNGAMCVCLSFCRKSKYVESFFPLFDFDAVCCPWCRSGMSWGYSELSPDEFSEAYPAFLKRFGWTIKTKTPSWNPLESNQFSGSYLSNLKGRTVSKLNSIISQ